MLHARCKVAEQYLSVVAVWEKLVQVSEERGHVARAAHDDRRHVGVNQRPAVAHDDLALWYARVEEHALDLRECVRFAENKSFPCTLSGALAVGRYREGVSGK